MTEKISIIIPVYKVQDYLAECIESVQRQTYNNLEIILVDDGSPDDCGSICDRYAAQDQRIYVIHRQNGGAACARNDGLDYATGDYISFIDGDDWIPETAVERLYQGLKEYDADCSVGRMIMVLDKNGILTPKKKPAAPLKCETSTEAIKRVMLTGSSMCNRLFKRQAFDGIRFPVGRINEDEVAAVHVYAACRKIVFLDQFTYYYRKRPNSITTSGFTLRTVDMYYNSIDNLAFIRKELPELETCAEFKYIKYMLYCYVNLRKLRKDPDARRVRERIHQDIRKNRSAALANRYVSLPLKVLMILCAL